MRREAKIVNLSIVKVRQVIPMKNVVPIINPSDSEIPHQSTLELVSQNTPSLEAAKQYIYHELDLSNICAKLSRVFHWEQHHVEKICKMYRNHLYLVRKYGAEFQLPPSEDIDEFWHQHILDTKQYKIDCNRIFGKYLDHYPYFGIDNTSCVDDLYSAYTRTLELYRTEFGEPIFQIRSKWHKLKAFLKETFSNKFKEN